VRDVALADTSGPHGALVQIALARGYFAEEGLLVDASVHNNGKAALQSMLDHQVDLATVAETPIMFSILKGDRLLLIANIEAGTANNGVVGRKDAGLLAPGDLKGKRIGYIPGTTSEFFMDSFLTATGLTRQDVMPVPLKLEAMEDAVLERTVDAVSVWNYALTRIARRLGAQGTVLYDHEIYTETYNVVANQDFVQRNPDAVRRALRAIIKAEEFAARKADEAQAIVAVASSTEVALVRDLWSNFHYRVVLDPTLTITLADEARWAMKRKLVDQTVVPDFRAFMHLDALRAVRPEAVTMTP
jgi:NitT/TauT family transport system substrate-binding protein